MLLLTAESDSWGICDAPPARQAEKPYPESWSRFPDYNFTAPPKPPPVEPAALPSLRSRAWQVEEERMRRIFVSEHSRLAVNYWRARVIHPEDRALRRAAVAVWNGELPELPEALAPRAWKWELSKVWWILELQSPPMHDELRAIILSNRSALTDCE